MDGSHSALLIQLLQPLLLVKVRALCYSPNAAQSELNDFFGFFRLAVAEENEHDLFFFAKAFEPILRHALHDKMTPLYLVICFLTC